MRPPCTRRDNISGFPTLTHPWLVRPSSARIGGPTPIG
ncbi:hypothetical protein BZL30_8283 [Mycobacterium kansasii]|uniref:Uncharacterized protein n=1 Tax=Mycobacterium kansasii TaxID=1768 RepID=A0A1V3WK34_MYCKA|nr:hypothetical protein BZL30_8283 [Mycobacterium kansasii]